MISDRDAFVANHAGRGTAKRAAGGLQTGKGQGENRMEGAGDEGCNGHSGAAIGQCRIHMPT